MKKFKLLAVATVAGLLGLTAQAASTGYIPVNIKVTGTFQTNNTTSGSTTKYNVIKVKITTKEMLKYVATEFDTTFPSGSKLVIDAFWGGDFSVLDKNGNVLLANASSNSEVDDNYSLYTDYDNYVYTGKDTDSSTTYKYSTIGYLYFENGNDSLDFEIYGLAKVNDSYPSGGGYNQSFKLTGADDAYFGSNGVASGSMNGSGKDLNY